MFTPAVAVTSKMLQTIKKEISSVSIEIIKSPNNNNNNNNTKTPNWTLHTYFGKYQCKITKHLNWEIILHVTKTVHAE